MVDTGSFRSVLPLITLIKRRNTISTSTTAPSEVYVARTCRVEVSNFLYNHVHRHGEWESRPQAEETAGTASYWVKISSEFPKHTWQPHLSLPALAYSHAWLAPPLCQLWNRRSELREVKGHRWFASLMGKCVSFADHVGLLHEVAILLIIIAEA